MTSAAFLSGVRLFRSTLGVLATVLSTVLRPGGLNRDPNTFARSSKGRKLSQPRTITTTNNPVTEWPQLVWQHQRCAGYGAEARKSPSGPTSRRTTPQGQVVAGGHGLYRSGKNVNLVQTRRQKCEKCDCDHVDVPLTLVPLRVSQTLVVHPMREILVEA